MKAKSIIFVCLGNICRSPLAEGIAIKYANEYKIQASEPGSPSEGDIWMDTTNNVFKPYAGVCSTSLPVKNIGVYFIPVL